MTSSDLSAGEIVAAVYEGLLGRSPDPVGLAHQVTNLRDRGLANLIRDFVQSAEFQSKLPKLVDLGRLALLPPMSVDTELSPSELDSLWHHVAKSWGQLGENDLLWSVITDDQYRADGPGSAAATRTFYEGGRFDRDYIAASLRRAGLAWGDFKVGVEYGCGAGRVTHWLAPRFDVLRAVDISAPHLHAAQRYVESRSMSNVDFSLLRTISDLSVLQGVDLFYSFIVLQHNPPPIIMTILDRAFAGLNAGGVALFQVPTYCEGYSFSYEAYAESEPGGMEMHFVPQRAILGLATRHGLRPLEIRNDHAVGNLDRQISTTFLMQKEDALRR